MLSYSRFGTFGTYSGKSVEPTFTTVRRFGCAIISPRVGLSSCRHLWGMNQPCVGNDVTLTRSTIPLMAASIGLALGIAIFWDWTCLLDRVVPYALQRPLTFDAYAITIPYAGHRLVLRSSQRADADHPRARPCMTAITIYYRIE